LNVKAVEPADGLHWRTRMDFAVSSKGRIGLFGARSNEVVEIKDCLIADARMNVSELATREWKSDPRVEVAVSSTNEVSITRSGRRLPIVKKADLILLDPPRTGAGDVAIKQMIKFKPRKIVYVACDPAALARDAKILADAGYKLDHIEAFDLFPMTQHIECVAGFSPAKR